MIEYCVVDSRPDEWGDFKIETFESDVNLKLSEGWQLHGPVCLCVYLDRSRDGLPKEQWAQAMTREKATP